MRSSRTLGVAALVLPVLLGSGCAVSTPDAQRQAYRQRLELGLVAPEDVQRFKTPQAAQQALVASAQAVAPVPDGALESALRAAAAAGNSASVKTLLSRRVQVNASDAWGTTALLQAARAGHTEVARSLLKAGALVNGRDGAMSPLAAAALGGHAPTVRLLLQNGADVDEAGLGGQAPLLLAVQTNRLEVAQLLLAAGASTRVLDRSGYHLLLVAIYEDHADMLALLLASGMDPNLPDSSGLTPLYWTDHLRLDHLSSRLRAAGGSTAKQPVRSALGTPFESGGY